MSTILNKSKLNNLANEIWKSAERLRGKFKAYEYQSVILPIIVIRLLESVLIDWREKETAEIWENIGGTSHDTSAQAFRTSIFQGKPRECRDSYSSRAYIGGCARLISPRRCKRH